MVVWHSVRPIHRRDPTPQGARTTGGHRLIVRVAHSNRPDPCSAAKPKAALPSPEETQGGRRLSQLEQQADSPCRRSFAFSLPLTPFVGFSAPAMSLDGFQSTDWSGFLDGGFDALGWVCVGTCVLVCLCERTTFVVPGAQRNASVHPRLDSAIGNGVLFGGGIR